MYASKYSAVEMQFVDQILAIMHAAIVWTVSVVIHWLLVNDQNVQQIKIAHTI